MGNHKYGEARCENEYLVTAKKKGKKNRAHCAGQLSACLTVSCLVSFLTCHRCRWVRPVPQRILPLLKTRRPSTETMLCILHWNTYTSDNICVKTSVTLTFVTARKTHNDRCINLHVSDLVQLSILWTRICLHTNLYTEKTGDKIISTILY